MENPEYFNKKIEASDNQSPITNGEVFDPEKEVEKIKKLPRENKRKAIIEFKNKWAYQREGLAIAQEIIIKTIRKNPDASSDELYDYIVKSAELFGFTKKQKELAKSVLEKYVAKHRFIKEIRKQFPDNIELFEDFFGRKPLGKIEVLEGPIFILFRVYNKKDFAYLHSSAFLERRSPTKKEIEESESSDGFAIEEFRVPRLRGLVAVESVDKDNDFIEDSKNIFIHEERHIINFLFEKEFKNMPENYNEMAKILMRLKMAENDNERKLVIGQYFSYIRRDFENLAKGEIIAYFAENYNDDYDLREMILDLIASEKDGGIYDYYSGDRDVIRKYIFTDITNIIGKKFGPLIESVANDVFVKEYKNIITEAVNSLKLLMDKKYSKEQIMALMQKEPLRKWPKVIRRLAAAENNNEYIGKPDNLKNIR